MMLLLYIFVNSNAVCPFLKQSSFPAYVLLYCVLCFVFSQNHCIVYVVFISSATEAAVISVFDHFAFKMLFISSFFNCHFNYFSAHFSFVQFTMKIMILYISENTTCVPLNCLMLPFSLSLLLAFQEGWIKSLVINRLL